MLKFDRDIAPQHQPQELDFKQQLQTLAQPGILGGHLIVNTKGALDRTNFLVSFWEKFKGLLGFCNRTHARLIEFKVLQFLSSGKNWVNTQDGVNMVIGLAKKAGLTQKNSKNHAELQALIDNIRSNVFNTPYEKTQENFTKTFFIQYKKYLTPFPAHLLKINEAFDNTAWIPQNLEENEKETGHSEHHQNNSPTHSDDDSKHSEEDKTSSRTALNNFESKAAQASLKPDADLLNIPDSKKKNDVGQLTNTPLPLPAVQKSPWAELNKIGKLNPKSVQWDFALKVGCTVAGTMAAIGTVVLATSYLSNGLAISKIVLDNKQESLAGLSQIASACAVGILPILGATYAFYNRPINLPKQENKPSHPKSPEKENKGEIEKTGLESSPKNENKGRAFKSANSNLSEMEHNEQVYDKNSNHIPKATELNITQKIPAFKKIKKQKNKQPITPPLNKSFPQNFPNFIESPSKVFKHLKEWPISPSSPEWSPIKRKIAGTENRTHSFSGKQNDSLIKQQNFESLLEIQNESYMNAPYTSLQEIITSPSSIEISKNLLKDFNGGSNQNEHAEKKQDSLLPLSKTSFSLIQDNKDIFESKSFDMKDPFKQFSKLLQTESESEIKSRDALEYAKKCLEEDLQPELVTKMFTEFKESVPDQACEFAIACYLSSNEEHGKNLSSLNPFKFFTEHDADNKKTDLALQFAVGCTKGESQECQNVVENAYDDLLTLFSKYEKSYQDETPHFAIVFLIACTKGNNPACADAISKHYKNVLQYETPEDEIKFSSQETTAFVMECMQSQNPACYAVLEEVFIYQLSEDLKVEPPKDNAFNFISHCAQITNSNCQNLIEFAFPELIEKSVSQASAFAIASLDHSICINPGCVKVREHAYKALWNKSPLLAVEFAIACYLHDDTKHQALVPSPFVSFLEADKEKDYKTCYALEFACGCLPGKNDRAKIVARNALKPLINAHQSMLQLKTLSEEEKAARLNYPLDFILECLNSANCQVAKTILKECFTSDDSHCQTLVDLVFDMQIEEDKATGNTLALTLLKKCIGIKSIACKNILENGFKKLNELFISLPIETQKGMKNYALQYAAACADHVDEISEKVLDEAFNLLSKDELVKIYTFSNLCLKGKKPNYKKIVDSYIRCLINTQPLKVLYFTRAIAFLIGFDSDENARKNGWKTLEESLSKDTYELWIKALKLVDQKPSNIEELVGFEKNVNAFHDLINKSNKSNETKENTLKIGDDNISTNAHVEIDKEENLETQNT